MKNIIAKYTMNENCTQVTVEEDGLITEMKSTFEDEFGRVSVVSSNNRKVEFIYGNTNIGKDDMRFDLATAVKVTEKGDDGKIRVIHGEGSIEVKGNLIFHRLPQFFGLTDDEPCITQIYLSIYLVNAANTYKGLIAEKIFVNHGDTPDTERYLTYYDDNFEKIFNEICINSGIFTESIKTYYYDTLERLELIVDDAAATSYHRVYKDGNHINSYLHDNRMGGVEAGASSLMRETETVLTDDGYIMQEITKEYVDR